MYLRVLQRTLVHRWRDFLARTRSPRRPTGLQASQRLAAPRLPSRPREIQKITSSTPSLLTTTAKPSAPCSAPSALPRRSNLHDEMKTLLNQYKYDEERIEAHSARDAGHDVPDRWSGCGFSASGPFFVPYVIEYTYARKYSSVRRLNPSTCLRTPSPSAFPDKF